MSYYPKPGDVTTTEAADNKSLDGAASTSVVAVDATLAVGNNDQTSLMTSITRLSAVYGGCDRSGGETESWPTLTGATNPAYGFSVRTEVLATGTDLRAIIGSSFTGAGNVLTNGVFVVEYTL